MSTAPRQSGPPEGGEAGRVRCMYCGANNFPSAPACWQCGRPLRALATGPPPASAAPRALGPAGGAFPSTPAAPAFRSGMDESDPALAQKAAAALGLLFPFFAVPVGIVFLMLDDRRKAQLGWITIGWSVAGTVISAIAFFVTLGPTLALLKSVLPTHGLPGGSLPGGGLPGLPSAGADPDNVNMIFLFACATLLAQSVWP